MKNITRFEKINLKTHPEFNEKWVQEQIALDPSILGLGEVVIKDKERIQSGAGRLDLLLQEVDGTRRYEVEIQLGKTDESHIIRTIEYWDIERKRYPNYDHCAVIVAEDITSRFLNVIQLFNGNIPLIALQMNAYKVEDKIGLIFTKVVDELKLGWDDAEDVQETVDRSYWENFASKETLKIADNLLELMKEFDPDIDLKYNKHYIGIVKQGRPYNFVILRPQKKNNLRIEVRLDRSEDIEKKLDASELDVMDYDSRTRSHRIRLTPVDIEKNKELIQELLYEAYQMWN